MYCYRCHNEAGKARICPTCGSNLYYFQKARRLSNAYFNEGLERASVRDLSGAIESLKTSLKFYKYNSQARNLLGLCYYEMGEIVEAIEEWILSKNYSPEDNRADFYLQEIQENQAHLNAINQTIKKYNQALLYCKQDSKDLAIIQLKKVLGLNSKFIKAYQLLALLYMQEGRFDLAKKTLRNATKIDANNTTTLRYLKETNQKLKERGSRKSSQSDDTIAYQSGNDTIIMPKRFKETSVGATLIALVAGLAVGCAATAVLVVPNAKKQVRSDYKQEILSANEEVSQKEQMISTLNDQITELQEELDSQTDAASQISAREASYENLILAYQAYLADDIVSAGSYLTNVDATSLSETVAAVYETVNTSVGEKYIQSLFDEGYSAYSSGDYALAVTDLQQVVDSDKDFSEGQAVYYLAQAMRRGGDAEGAKQYYQYVIDNYPKTERARTAANYVK